MERRKFKRIRATASVGYSVAGTALPALTYDLSAHGCMMQVEAGSLDKGEKLELSFGDELLVKGRVVWVRKRNVGIEFDAPLSVHAVKTILFNVIGTGLQHALQGSSARLVARHLHPFLRWWPKNMLRLPRPDFQLDRDGKTGFAISPISTVG